MMEQSALLTSESIVWPNEEVFEVAVVGMKLVPLLSSDVVSGGTDLVVKLCTLLVDDSLSFSNFINFGNVCKKGCVLH